MPYICLKTKIMVRILYVIAITFLLSVLTVENAKAQAFSKGDFKLSVGLTGGNFYNFNSAGLKNKHRFVNTGGVSVQGEWGIHEYVGMGFFTGIQGGSVYWGDSDNSYKNRGVLSIPIGMNANFHFYQLISDKSSKNIHADKLDVYAGLSLGTGLSVVPGDGRVNGIFYVGPHVGARFFFNPNFGVYLELGYGQAYANAGLVFQL